MSKNHFAVNPEIESEDEIEPSGPQSFGLEKQTGLLAGLFSLIMKLTWRRGNK